MTASAARTRPGHQNGRLASILMNQEIRSPPIRGVPSEDQGKAHTRDLIRDLTRGRIYLHLHLHRRQSRILISVRTWLWTAGAAIRYGHVTAVRYVWIVSCAGLEQVTQLQESQKTLEIQQIQEIASERARSDRRAWVFACTLVLVLGGGLLSLVSAPQVGDEASRDQESWSFMNRPFKGAFPLHCGFDHNVPIESDGTFLDSMGDVAAPRCDGHFGYDWNLPLDTPVLAVATGVVVSVGEADRWCGRLGRRIPWSPWVELVHVAPNGMVVYTRYAHLDAVDVELFERVESGQTIGKSGQNGCATFPHLHFDVTVPRDGFGFAYVDPYGWYGAGVDPSLERPLGAQSRYMWLPGEAPSPVSAAE